MVLIVSVIGQDIDQKNNFDQPIDLTHYNAADEIDFRNFMGIDFITTPVDELMSKMIKLHNLTDPSPETLDAIRRTVLICKDGGRVRRDSQEKRCLNNNWYTLHSLRITASVQAQSANPPEGCGAKCFQLHNQGVAFATYNMTNQQCYCQKQPFGGGSVNSGYKDYTFSSSFYNNTFGSNGCGAYIAGGQRLYSNDLSVFSATNNAQCFMGCSLGGHRIWTRGNGNCICQGSSWNPQDSNSVLKYFPGWTFGVSFSL